MTTSPSGSGAYNPIDRLFAPLIGLPAWHAQKGHGSMLTFEFGKPSLEIREPIEASKGASAEVRTRLAQRRVTPRGEWHLWIYCCSWRCIANGVQIADSNSSAIEMAAAAAELDGQRLLAVNVDPLQGRSSFKFDLGGLLETWPGDDSEDEQWFVYCESGDVFAYRADGHYSWGASDERAGSEIWLPLAPVSG